MLQLFQASTQQDIKKDPPGRTFTRIPTGEYFGLQDNDNATPEAHRKSKLSKINQIKSHQMKPKYISYQYSTNGLDIKNARVVFQKEIFAEKWNMLHVSEISFIVHANEFQELEEMASVNLKKDFKDILENTYQGKERRQQTRV